MTRASENRDRTSSSEPSVDPWSTTIASQPRTLSRQRSRYSAPFRQTTIAELANGSIGYVPTRTAYPQGNYEVVSARCAAGSGEKLVDEALRQLRSAFPKK